MNTTGEPIPRATPIEEVKKSLIDPKIISKQIDPEGRTETARAALGAKAEALTTREGLTDKERKIQQIAELTSASYQREQQKVQELTQRLEKLIVKIKDLLGIDDKQVTGLQTEIDTIKEERWALIGQSSDIEEELKALEQRQVEIPEPKQLIEAYYEKMATQPLSNEQKRNLLKPEVLASLTDEEYVALWRRLNPFFLSHVTRQGFRDHNAMVYHSAGIEEFHNGFLGVVEDGKKTPTPDSASWVAE